MRADDKRLVNSGLDISQLLPIKYKWAWQCYLNGCANHWMPTEVAMAKDIEHWRSDRLTDAERKVVLRNLGFFSAAETMIGVQIQTTLNGLLTAPEVHQYLQRQSFEEALHAHTFQYVVDALGLNGAEVYNAYNELHSIGNKDRFYLDRMAVLTSPGFTTATPEGLHQFLAALFAQYMCLEGIFFYAGFVMILSLGRRNLMPGICEQFQYILRDETVHFSFGRDLINGILAENPDARTPELMSDFRDMVCEAVALECAYGAEALGDGILGVTPEGIRQYVECIADRRLSSVGLPTRYGSQNPFPWMSETIDLAKEKNFFETRVTEYQSGGLSWE